MRHCVTLCALLVTLTLGGCPGRTSGDDSGAAGQVLERVNDERAARGLDPLTRNAQLDAAAARHAADMRANRFFDHTGSDGSVVGDRASDAGYAWVLVGENIAEGYPTAATVMDGWMNSDGHRANILNAGFTEMGLAVNESGAPLWVQVFAAPQ